MTPVLPGRTRDRPLDLAANALAALRGPGESSHAAPLPLIDPLRQLRLAQRELTAPVTRVQMALHPWVAYGVMPLFALANAGVSFGGAQTGSVTGQSVMLGTLLALVAGKPLGVVLTSWLVVRLRWCTLPPGVDWQGVWLVGLLAGIGFTMSIFIATLAFEDPALLDAAKLGVLSASLIAALAGLAWGAVLAWRRRPPQTLTQTL